MQACKPGSVPHLRAALIIYLAHASQRESSSLPVMLPLAQEKWSAPFLQRHHLFGLSTRKVYHAPAIAGLPVGSYPTFSPLPHPEKIGSG